MSPGVLAHQQAVSGGHAYGTGQTDLNFLSVLQYAVQVLKVEHVIVCGHYRCGGVAASVDGNRHGLIDNWIKAIGDIAEANEDELNALSGEERLNRLCELNVLAQARNVSRTNIIRDAWSGGQDVKIHSWIYGLSNGRLKGLADPLTL